jgi:hypothetical protein
VSMKILKYEKWKISAHRKHTRPTNHNKLHTMEPRNPLGVRALPLSLSQLRCAPSSKRRGAACVICGALPHMHGQVTTLPAHTCTRVHKRALLAQDRVADNGARARLGRRLVFTASKGSHATPRSLSHSLVSAPPMGHLPAPTHHTGARTYQEGSSRHRRTRSKLPSHVDRTNAHHNRPRRKKKKKQAVGRGVGKRARAKYRIHPRKNAPHSIPFRPLPITGCCPHCFVSPPRLPRAARTPSRPLPPLLLLLCALSRWLSIGWQAPLLSGASAPPTCVSS